MLIYIIFTSLAVMLASLIGVFSVWRRVGVFIENNLGYLVSFSAGVFLVVSYNLSLEVFERTESFKSGLFWIIAGTIGVLILFKFIPSFHHHHDDNEEGSHSHSSIDARRILISDGLHNIGDGILLAASFAVSPLVGFGAGISIFVHEIVQEVSEFFVLRQAGFSTKKALISNFLVSSTIFLGALGSYFLLDSFEAIEAPLLGIVAGSFLIVVVYDLIPHSVRTSEGKTHYLKHIGWFLTGMLLMFLIGVVVIH